MAVLAAHTERGREAAHDDCHGVAPKVLGENLEVLGRTLLPATATATARHLRYGWNRGEQGERGEGGH